MGIESAVKGLDSTQSVDLVNLDVTIEPGAASIYEKNRIVLGM